LSGLIFPNIRSILEKSRNKLQINKERLDHVSTNFIVKNKQTLTTYSNKLVNIYDRSVQKKLLELKNYERTTIKLVKSYIKSKQTHIENLAKAKDYLDPKNVMKRGYSITKKNGQILKSSKNTEKGDTIQTYLYQGKIISRVSEKDEEN
jgi:exodeoxyribonuclease VII large subunit